MISARVIRCHVVRLCLSVVGLLAVGSCTPISDETPGATAPTAVVQSGSSTPVAPATSGVTSAQKAGKTLRLHGSNTIGLSLMPTWIGY
jgi:hypothetical protein